MVSKNQSQYVNTVVFCIVAGIVSLMLLLLVFNSNASLREFTPLVITIEVGLIVIIVLAIWNIISYEQSIDQSIKDGYNANLNVTTCPDYWTQNGLTCSNTFTSANVTFTMQGNAANAGQTTFALSNYNNQSIQNVCSNVYSSNLSPWSQVDAICDSFNLNG